jgi:G3E family GTPase
MKTDLYIISGFLGAGKTTLIQEMLDTIFVGRSVILVENDFGAVSIDAALMRTRVQVRELVSGCICCSIAGDFVRELNALLTRYKPDIVLIEPSGVSKLSEVKAACVDAKIAALADLVCTINVVDAAYYETYSENFGEFYFNQILNADINVIVDKDILDLGVEDRRHTLSQVCETVSDLNQDSAVLRWSELFTGGVITSYSDYACDHSPHNHDADCSCGHSHDHAHGHSHDHSHDYACDPSPHNHDADDVFDSITIRNSKRYCLNEVEELIEKCFVPESGGILRAKGLLLSPAHFGWNLQYTPGSVSLDRVDFEPDESAVCFIGRDLDRDTLVRLFD